MAVKKSKLAQIKTRPTEQSVEDFLNGLTDEQQRSDSITIVEMMKKATGEKPKMWGTSMIGFGIKRYTSPASGREVDWFRIGFSPRKAALSLHLVTDIKNQQSAMKDLGKYKTGSGCLYIKKLSDVKLDVLRQIISAAAK